MLAKKLLKLIYAFKNPHPMVAVAFKQRVINELPS